MTTDPYDTDPPVPPACVPTVARIQRVLDGELSSTTLDDDPHAAGCTLCRGRVRAAHVLADALADRPPSVLPSPAFADAVTVAASADRRYRTRLRWASVGGGLAVAAGLLVAAYAGTPPSQSTGEWVTARRADEAPAPTGRVDESLAEAGTALGNIGRTLAGPATAAPEMFAPLADAFAAAPSPLVGLEPAARSLAELPETARAGLEPVTAPAYRAFSRLLRDVGAVQPPPPPKS